ncbi:ribonuclease P/MRP subunit POP4 [Leptinotarsa decemlineata]|uniref:ribonuclease P/MRP subunit POP4 n=1 Tax=Leptinotarsa decemlineata TaxID=7539 RepID=UPI000C254541|nr:uncharacterized protein LOC111508059 [Leptinotarsa decemlineata]
MTMSSSSGLKDTLKSVLPEEILPCQRREDQLPYIKNALMRTLPATDSKNLKNDLEWKFLLDRHSFQKKKQLKKKKSFLTRKQRSELNLLKLPKDGWSYVSLQPIRDMWKDYMRQNLSLFKVPQCIDQEWSTFSSVLAKSELVGAELTVIKSKIPSQVGMSGTVILETKMTFQIVVNDSKLKTLVKDNSVFEFHLDNIKFTIYGKHITTRPSERSVKKIRGQMVPEL